jgi:hypothetical protein
MFWRKTPLSKVLKVRATATGFAARAAIAAVWVDQQKVPGFFTLLVS